MFYALNSTYFKHAPIVLDSNNPYDACGARSMIASDNVALLARPADFSIAKSTLVKNQMVNVCGQHGDWSAVVVSVSGSNDCEIEQALEQGDRQYLGPCEFGWVPTYQLRLFAG